MQTEQHIEHYYGDVVRNIYLTMALIMLVITPFIKYGVPFSKTWSITGIIVLTIIAGLLNPKSRFIIFIGFLVSIITLVIFGSVTVMYYTNLAFDLFFWSNLSLAVLALFSVYFSSKTLRGNLIKN